MDSSMYITVLEHFLAKPVKKFPLMSNSVPIAIGHVKKQPLKPVIFWVHAHQRPEEGSADRRMRQRKKQDEKSATVRERLMNLI